jgi:hypothetical protein
MNTLHPAKQKTILRIVSYLLRCGAVAGEDLKREKDGLREMNNGAKFKRYVESEVKHMIGIMFIRIMKRGNKHMPEVGLNRAWSRLSLTRLPCTIPVESRSSIKD